MQQLELLSIESPCINVCESNQRGYCLGCFRSREERFNWQTMTPEQKGQVLELCKQRSRRRQSKIASQNKQNKQASETARQAIPVSQIPVNQIPVSESTATDKVKEAPVDDSTPQQTVKDMGLDLFDL